MLAQAMAAGKPVASDPIPLLRQDGPVGHRARRTRFRRKAPTRLAGFVTFSYELAPLMLTNDDRSLFSVVLKDPRDAMTSSSPTIPGRRHLARGQARMARRRRWCAR